jgi:hypothetical protein
MVLACYFVFASMGGMTEPLILAVIVVVGVGVYAVSAVGMGVVNLRSLVIGRKKI